MKLRSVVYVLAILLATFSCSKDNGQPAPIIIPPPPPPPPPVVARFNINAALVTPSPTKETKAVYDFLKENYGKKILSGVMTLNSFDETEWLKTNTGKEPAIVGLDFMHTNRGYTWYNDKQPIQDAKAYW